MNKLIIQMLCIMILCASCLSTNPPVSQHQAEVRATATAQPATKSKCDELLDKCAVVVKEQQKTIEVQSKLALKQDELIKTHEERIDSLKSTNTKLGVGAALSNLIWLLIIIF